MPQNTNVSNLHFPITSPFRACPDFSSGGSKEGVDSDHLGSSSFITDASGITTQHLQYLPFGETFVEQTSNAPYNTPYKLSGKKKDEETGYSYFGARYLNSDISIWLSVDPMADKYPNISPYAYCNWNPVILVDPDGREIEGVTYDKKTKEYTFTDAAIKRGSKDYIEARTTTKSGEKGIQWMINAKETYTIHVTDKPLFSKNDKGEYGQLHGLAENNSLFISTFNEKARGENLTNSMVIDGENLIPAIIEPTKIISPQDPDYQRAFKSSGLKKFEQNANNAMKSIQQLIHGIGAHEERHLFQAPEIRGDTFSSEKDAMMFEVYGRKEYLQKFNKK